MRVGGEVVRFLAFPVGEKGEGEGEGEREGERGGFNINSEVMEQSHSWNNPGINGLLARELYLSIYLSIYLSLYLSINQLTRDRVLKKYGQGRNEVRKGKGAGRFSSYTHNYFLLVYLAAAYADMQTIQGEDRQLKW